MSRAGFSIWHNGTVPGARRWDGETMVRPFSLLFFGLHLYLVRKRSETWRRPFFVFFSFFLVFTFIWQESAWKTPKVPAGPAPRGAFWGRASPNENCATPSEDCVPKKLTGSVLLECCFFVDFAINTDFLWPHPKFMKLRVYFGTKTPFFLLIFTSEFVEIRTFFEMKIRICKNARTF